MSKTEDVFVNNLRVAMEKFKKEYVSSKEQEMRIYTLINTKKPLHEATKTDIEDSCYVYLEPLPSLNHREIIVQMKIYEREDPEVKSLEWMQKKSELEKSMENKFEETLLVSGNGNEVYEGLSSNFFAVRNGNVYIAPEGTILLGTIMTHVLEACEKLNIPVIREPPSLKYLHEWSSCFITSTSRLVLPIQRICFPDHPSINEKTFTETCPELTKIQEFVNMTLEEHSVEII